jgi:hypothetical protein
MKGWTRDGLEIELTSWQADAVQQILAAHAEGKQVFIQRGRAYGWSVVWVTVERLSRQASGGSGE